MIKFDKNDIPALDFIIDKLTEHSFTINLEDLKKANFINLKIGGYESLTQALDENKEFERLLSIIDSYNCAECHFKKFLGEDAFVTSSPRTLQFKKQGGFKKAYKELKENQRREKIELKLAESNIKANKLNEKNSKFNRRVNFINIIIGILNILVATIIGIITYLSYKAGLLEL